MINYDSAGDELILLCSKDHLTLSDIERLGQVLPTCDL